MHLTRQHGQDVALGYVEEAGSDWVPNCRISLRSSSYSIGNLAAQGTANGLAAQQSRRS